MTRHSTTNSDTIECPDCGTDRVTTFDTGDAVCANNHNFDVDAPERTPADDTGAMRLVIRGPAGDVDFNAPADAATVRSVDPDDDTHSFHQEFGFVVYTDDETYRDSNYMWLVDKHPGAHTDVDYTYGYWYDSDCSHETVPAVGGGD